MKARCISSKKTHQQPLKVPLHQEPENHLGLSSSLVPQKPGFHRTQHNPLVSFPLLPQLIGDAAEIPYKTTHETIIWEHSQTQQMLFALR